MRLADLAAELHEARLAGRTVEPISHRHPGFTQSDAYAVQSLGIALRLAAGEQLVGGKLGFTSRAMRRAMGVDSPNYGWLTDAMARDDRLASLIHPKAEPEMAFLLADDLTDPNTSATAVIAATAGVAPCLEIVDSRFHEFRFALEDNIADNSSAGLFVLGDPVPIDFDPALVGVVLAVNGTVVETAAGAAALDDPAEGVAWMARQVAAGDRPLLAGDIVISGGLTGPVDLQPGTIVRAEFDRIGTCEVKY